MALLEEVCHWEWALGVQKYLSLPVSYLYLLPVHNNVSTQLVPQNNASLFIAMFPMVMGMDSSYLSLSKHFLLLQVALVRVFVTEIEK